MENNEILSYTYDFISTLQFNIQSLQKIKAIILFGSIARGDYDKESDNIIEREININDLVNLPYHYVIISLLSEDSKLLKIGLLFVINLEKKYVLLFSDFNFKEQMKVKKISLGSLRLSTKGNHQGYLYL